VSLRQEVRVQQMRADRAEAELAVANKHMPHNTATVRRVVSKWLSR
jgi:hypothetical protein